MNTKTPHRVAALFLLAVALLFNVWTLSRWASGGRVDGIARFYIGVLDAMLVLGALALTAGGAFRRIAGRVLYVMMMLVWIEGFSILAVRILSGAWHFENARTATIFDPHPYLVGVPTPGVSETRQGKTISHNRLGFRGREIAAAKPRGTTRVVVMGGSSTYCAGVTDGETWPEYLDQALGDGFQVINMGSPGYSTAEHLIQTALQLSDLDPDVALYYVGWNDSRNMHVRDLKSDYSDFHGKSQHHNLNLGRIWRGPNFATARLAVLLFQKIGWVDRTPDQTIAITGETSTNVDERALSIYERNLRGLAALCREQGVKPVFVPQIMNYLQLTSSASYGWMPYVRDCDLKDLIPHYNDRLRAVAESEKAGYAGDVLAFEWKDSDFVDYGHFSAAGNRQFARMIADYLVRERLVPAPRHH